MSNSIVAMIADEEVCKWVEEGVRDPDWSSTESLVGVERADDEEAPKGARGCGKTSVHGDKGLEAC